MISVAGFCFAQGEHGRRAGAELHVLLGDVRKLREFATTKTDSSTPPDTSLIEKGLVDRIRGSLAVIDILFRLADQETSRLPVSYATLVQSALKYVENERWGRLEELLSEINPLFPLRQPDLPDSKKLRESSRELHERMCAGCHDNPARQVERPAYNLYRQSRSSTDIEFFARMLIGVRGDRVTGIDNPLTDVELAGLIYLYRSDTE